MRLSELVACTLTDTDLKSQKERWLALSQNFGLARAETAEGIEIRFRYHPAVEEELRTLVTVENECCTWASWDVERHPDALVMTARSQGHGIATLHRMLAGFA